MTNEASHANGKAIEARDQNLLRTIHTPEKIFGTAQEKRMFKDHEFELKFTCNNKNKAGKQAGRYRKRGFYTRVIEISPGLFSVYRRHRKVDQAKPSSENK